MNISINALRYSRKFAFTDTLKNKFQFQIQNLSKKLILGKLYTYINLLIIFFKNWHFFPKDILENSENSVSWMLKSICIGTRTPLPFPQRSTWQSSYLWELISVNESRSSHSWNLTHLSLAKLPTSSDSFCRMSYFCVYSDDIIISVTFLLSLIFKPLRPLTDKLALWGVGSSLCVWYITLYHSPVLF